MPNLSTRTDFHPFNIPLPCVRLGVFDWQLALAGFVSVGYHHVLMVICSIAIILLCKIWYDIVDQLCSIRTRSAHESIHPAVLLAGCTSSNGLSNVYLVSLRYRNDSSGSISTSSIPGVDDPVFVNPGIAEQIYNVSQPHNVTILEVRAGFMGLCLTQSDGTRFCSSSAAALASMVKDEGRNETDTADPLNLIWIANNFKDKIVFNGLM